MQIRDADTNADADADADANLEFAEYLRAAGQRLQDTHGSTL